MNADIPALSIIFMMITASMAFAIPIALLIYFLKKKKADILPFFIGCAVFVLFAMVLEGALNNLIIVRSGAGGAIRGNTWLYALYGGFMAGLFEETGRFVAFKTVLAKKRDNDANALMYGAGHGGIEAILLVGLTYVSNVVLSLLSNSGGLAALTSALPQEASAALESGIGQLAAAEPWYFLVALAERCIAIALHISLSVLVWFAAKKRGKLYLYPLAVLIHLVMDAAAVLLAGAGVSILAVEGCLLLIAAAGALISFLVWKRNSVPESRGI